MDALHGYLKAGRATPQKLASELGITSSAISQWHRVPAERTIDIERLTGIPRHDLRPDLYPRAA
jgi:DNA-binding transcriptional regulator YdaS (Cro superfamily)